MLEELKNKSRRNLITPNLTKRRQQFSPPREMGSQEIIETTNTINFLKNSKTSPTNRKFKSPTKYRNTAAKP
jgi:hypothetical protein